MPRQTVPLYALNRGEVSKLALSRVDVDKLRLAAERQVNWLPLTMGPMTLRPGSGYIGEVLASSTCRLMEFVYSTTDAALIELTQSVMRVWVDDALVTRPAVSATIQPFSAWTQTISTGATIDVSHGDLRISNVRQGDISSAYGSMAITAGQESTEHALRITIYKGPVLFKIGTTVGGEEILSSTPLDNGVHSIAFTPGVSTVYCQFDSTKLAQRTIGSIAVEGAGVMTLPTPWTSDLLNYVQYDQSADVIYVACRDCIHKKIERRSRTSWSIVDYRVPDGPFPSAPGDESFTFSASYYEGDITLTCNKPFFTSSHVGAKLRLFHNGQTRYANLSKADTYTHPIRVAGTSTAAFSSKDREFAVSLSGTWSGTVTIERTYDPDGLTDWVSFKSYTANGLYVIDDQLNNVIVWYRVGFMPSGYTSGTCAVGVAYNGGGGAGICEIVTVTDSTHAYAEVVDYIDSKGARYGYLHNQGVAANWRMSQWNAVTGYPSSCTLHEGRLWWAGANKSWGSVSDAYASFDFEKTGDAAPIVRSIGKGPVAHTNFMLSLSRLAIGADGGVVTARSSSFDEPLTPTAFNLKYSTNQGTAPLRAVQIDNNGVFVQRSGRRVYLLSFVAQSADFKPFDLTRLNMDIGVPGFVDIAVQRQPDTRLLLVRGDGQLAVLLSDEQDDVQAWWRVETDGVIERVATLPGALEDQVYIVVRRTINGATKRYIEKFARLDECKGGAISRLADCHIVYSGAATNVLGGLGHLEGKNVIVWADGKEIGFDEDNPDTVHGYTVSGGQITLPVQVSQAVIGLPYDAEFVSAKLAYAAAQGTAINQPKRVGHMGFIMNTTHYQGVRFGHWHEDPDAQVLDSLPRVEMGEITAKDTIWSVYDQQMIEAPGEWDTDARLTIVGQAPRPATVQSVALEIETSG